MVMVLLRRGVDISRLKGLTHPMMAAVLRVLWFGSRNEVDES
jgi:hypothetical protein